MDKKEAIRKSAAELIARDGFSNTRMKAIADDAGIAVGTIYNYFQSKDEILEYIFIYEHEKRVQIVKDLIMKGLPFTDLLEELITIHINRVKDEPAVAKIMLQEETTPFICSSETVKESFKRLVDVLEVLIKLGQNQGAINKKYDLELLSQFITCTFCSIIMITYDKINEKDFEKAKMEAVCYILNGIK